MIASMCLVQQGQISDCQQAALREAMARLAQEAFDEALEIEWIEVARGDGFTEAKPSTSAIVQMTAPRPLSPTQREPLIRKLCDLWIEGSGLSANEVVAVIRDPQS